LWRLAAGLLTLSGILSLCLGTGPAVALAIIVRFVVLELVRY
jgi:hypothetical protein